MWNRREFLKLNGALAAGAIVAPPRVSDASWRPGSPDPRGHAIIAENDPRISVIATRALDAATKAGAQYADVRMTYFRTNVNIQRLHIGVRALVNGYWGFASSPYWAPDDAAELGRTASALGKDAARGPGRPVELAATPVVKGTWRQPMTEDPFEVAYDEVSDWIQGTEAYMKKLANARAFPTSLLGGLKTGFVTQLIMTKQLQVFASTEGSYVTQTLGGISWTIDFSGVVLKDEPLPSMVGIGGSLPYLLTMHPELTPAALRDDQGWARIKAYPAREVIELAFDEMEANTKLPIKAAEIGRYDAVLDWSTMTKVVNSTFGIVTPLDRALGYRANTVGTSYLGPDPSQFLGTAVAPPSITVTTDRAGVKRGVMHPWDAEGVARDEVTLVKDGVLVDYQTTRESASWLSQWYTTQGRSVQSNACASASDASTVFQCGDNVRLAPSTTTTSLEDLLANLSSGLFVQSWNVFSDQQGLNGVMAAWGNLYEIKRGKKTARLAGGGSLYRAPEFWKSIKALGGSSSAYGTAVPALVKEFSIIDPTRKA